MERFDLAALEKLSPEERARRVLIVQDTFTTVYDAPVVHDLISLVAKTGKIPVLLPLKPNGKALHIRGYLREFAATAARTSDFYNRVFRLGIPMVGVDPAIVLCYRDEYRKTENNRPATRACVHSLLRFPAGRDCSGRQKNA